MALKNSTIEILQKQMSHSRGLYLGFILSTSLGIIAMGSLFLVTYSVLALMLELEEDIPFIAGALATILGVVVFTTIFVKGLRTEHSPDAIPQNHRGLLIAFGSRIHIEISEGWFWWLPLPFGTVDVHSMKTDVLIPSFDVSGEPITLHDGSWVKSCNISIIYRKMEGKLWEVTQLETPIEDILKEMASDRIRNAAILATMGVPDEYVISEYNNLRPLILMGSLVKWKNLIWYGATYPKEGSGIDPSLRGTSVLTEEEEKEIRRLGKELPHEGLAEVAAKHGIEIVNITISSFKLPDELQNAIDENILEPLQKSKEVQDIETFNKLTDMIMKDSDGSYHRIDAMRLAAVKQNTPGVNIQVIDGNGNLGDKVVAAGLLSKGEQK